MNKKIITVITAAVVCCCCFSNIYAGILQTEFSYNEGDPAFFGSARAETYDVAIKLDAPILQGMEIVGVTAYVSGTEGMLQPKVWLSHELKLESRVNAPDICSYDVAVEDGNFMNIEMGRLSHTFEQPVVIDEKGVYAGFSITVNDVSQSKAQDPIAVTRNANPNGFYLHSTKTQLQWKNMSQQEVCAAVIVTLRGELPANRMSVVEGSDVFAVKGEGFSTQFQITNHGCNDISSITYTYSIDGTEATAPLTMNLAEPIIPDLARSSAVELNFPPINDLGKHTVEISVIEVNGDNNISDENSGSFVATVIPFMPVHRPLVEEFTGLWCGWCPRGFLAMEWLAELYGDGEVTICYHSNDAMAVTSTYPVAPGGLPSAYVDRQSRIDPYFGSSGAQFGISQDVEEAMAQVAIGEISAEAEIDGNLVNVTTYTTFVTDVENSNYLVGYVLVANGLNDPTWAQKNDYASTPGLYKDTPLEILTTWDNPAYGLVFNDVAADVSGMNGVAGSLPSTLKTGETYEHSYSFDISRNSLIKNKENMAVVVFITDRVSRKILNANKYSFKQPEAGVDGIDNSDGVSEVRYYNLEGQQVSRPGKGFYIKLEVLDNGQTRSSKVIF